MEYKKSLMTSPRGSDSTPYLKTLNKHKPEHPPDIYYIRRNPDFLKKYLDPINMENITDQASTFQRQQYKRFSLDPMEISIIED